MAKWAIINFNKSGHQTLKESASSMLMYTFIAVVIGIVINSLFNFVSYKEHQSSNTLHAEKELDEKTKSTLDHIFRNIQLLVSTNAIMDYLTSRETGRFHSETAIEDLFSRVEYSGIIGVYLLSKNGFELKYGKQEGESIGADLHYMSNRLDRIGDYIGRIVIFFSPGYVADTIATASRNIEICDSCPFYQPQIINNTPFHNLRLNLLLPLKPVPEEADAVKVTTINMFTMVLLIVISVVVALKKLIIHPILGGQHDVPMDKLKRSSEAEKIKNKINEQVSRSKEQLARKIHNNVQSQILSVRVGIKVNRQLQQDDRSILLDGLNNISKEINSIINDLKPEELSTIGLKNWINEAFNINTPCFKNSNIKASSTLNFSDDYLTSSQTEAVYEILNEVKNNIIKHSKCTLVKICACVTRDQYLLLEVKDNGTGFDSKRIDSSRLGLRSIQDIADIQGGKLTIKSKPSQGTIIKLTIPLRAERIAA